jgi:hypothetical protein
MKLVTRAQLGWPASAAPRQSTTRGVKVHYEGTHVSTRLLTDHSACIAEWKAIRTSHLNHPTENYSDVAYNYAACPHGYLLEGRGIGRRTGANGNATLNSQHYAVLGLVGSSGLTDPPDPMLHAIRDGIDLLRKNGADSEIKGHRDGYATACPGARLYAWVQKGAPRPTSTSEEDDMPLTDADVQRVAKATVQMLIAGGGVLENSDLDRIIARDAVPAARPPHANADYETNKHWSLGYAIQTGVESSRRAVVLLEEMKEKGVVDPDELADALGPLLAPIVEQAIATAVVTVAVNVTGANTTTS